MTKVFELISSEQTQYAVYLAISLAVIICTAALYFHDKLIYQPFFGRINPIAGVVVISILGFILLTYLLARGWFDIFLVENLQGLAIATALAVLLALVMILFDSRIVLPEEVNRPFPESLLFYPTMGFVVEILVHVLPLALLLPVASAIFKDLTFEQIIWPCILIVALLEPILQTSFSLSSSYPRTAVIFIALHNFLFNFIQLALFKQYDFVTMYSFRLVYYLFWHIIWGVIRLQLLF
jgi:hypothetical protein